VVANGSYQIGTHYVLLHADGGRTGEFTTGDISALFGSAIRANVSYDADNVFLNLDPNAISPFLPPNATPNQKSVAGAIDQILASGNFPPGFLSLFNLTPQGLLAVLSQLSGEGATGAQGAAFLSGGQFLNAMLNPFMDGRDGGFGAATPYAPERKASRIEAAFASVLKAPPARNLVDDRWGVWGTAYGGYNRTDGDPALGSNDLTARTGGFAAGADYRYAPGSVLGVAVAIGETSWNVSGLGKGNADVAQLGGYASTRIGALYLAAAVAGAWHNVTTDRVLMIAGTDRLRGDFDAQSFGARFEGGWRFGFGSFGLTPYAAVQVQSVHTPAYAEAAIFGSNQFALGYQAQTTIDTRSELGGWADTRMLLANGTSLTLRGRAAWVHDYDPGRRINALFQTLPAASFTVDGARAPEDAALLSAVAELRMPNGVSFVGKLDGEFANGATTYSGTGTVRYAW
jgi:outer membrane autotransporter protein